MINSTFIEKKNWYALYTMPKAERKVFERLLLMHHDLYLPLITTIRYWSDRKKKVTSPLISSFVFIYIEESKLNTALSVDGVCGVLKYLKKPAVIKEHEIESLKILLNDFEKVTVLENIEFEKGELVIVVKGPFKGLLAQCVFLHGKHRIVVGIEGVGSTFEVNIPLSFIEKRNNTTYK